MDAAVGVGLGNEQVAVGFKPGSLAAVVFHVGAKHHRQFFGKQGQAIVEFFMDGFKALEVLWADNNQIS